MTRSAAPAVLTTSGSFAVHYRVEVHSLKAHLFKVTMTVLTPAACQVLRLPAWIPGSYLIREFSKHLQQLKAQQGGVCVPVQQLDKASWQVECQPDVALVVDYLVYAQDASVRTAWLNTERGFFNGTSLCLQAPQAAAMPHALELMPVQGVQGWQVATGLEPVHTDASGFGLYQACDYDTLVDCPVEMGAFWSARFEVFGIPHRLVVAGAPPSFDGAQLLADTRALCEAELRFWHDLEPAHGPDEHTPAPNNKQRGPVPFGHYVFMLAAVHDGYGGLEHKNSTALIASRKDLPRKPRTTLASSATHTQPEGYTTLLGLISHEYFHTWNVKRLRPAELAQVDYGRENYTQLLWFFEGFTSYYDDLFLRRAQRIDNATYLKLIAKTINQVRQTPGRHVQTVAQSSFDAWVKYYRQDENTANATVSYYTKGALVALCLDLTLRAEGRTTLDAVMRGLWSRCAAGPMAEADLLAVLESLGRRSFYNELQQWVHSTQELPVLELLERHGVKVSLEPESTALQLGLRVKETGGVFVQQVLRDSVAEHAGFAAGDEWLAIQTDQGNWRLHTLDELLLYTGPTEQVTALIARDKRIHPLTLTLPAATSQVRLAVGDLDAVNQWMDSHPPEKP